ncbi:flagellar biosynthesis anti-sigma factor FlgM [Marinomonas sp. 15G1-11]|uniref:Negative regulator of flagellin synthesis n=1 Tax=Marinomonas phaeophyticola TaxID=3004091 RepID=A0ABT4JSD9_9GAMM|nr:flagellar biosynthesis anti-sigma factor FlgM [Marinomonas sp. 15G1-11]MCZ2721186.1 flagellar biosynthesis anti-sigma factor FlgM [Marinomonas sp. 15G1-11]
MAINISNGLGNQANIGKNERLQKSSESTENRAGQNVSSKDTLSEDTVQLSDAAQILKDQEAKISNLPDMDMEKVERVKQAIAAGEYQIDTQKLASNMQSIDALFA